MFDKILIAWGILLGSILIIENMVSGLFWYLFLDTSANNGLVIFVSLLIWAGMWYWIKWLSNSKNSSDYDNDEYDF